MEATLTELVQHLPVFMRRLDGEILFWSEGCTDLYGFAADEALGHKSFELLQTVLPEPLAAIEATLSAHGEWSGRLRRITKSGRELWTETAWKLRDSVEPGGLILVEQSTDITSRVELEERSALLARELEHRVKNILTIVQALARSSFPGVPEQQLATFERRLVALSGANKILQEASWQEADLAAIVREVARSFDAEERIRLVGPPVAVSSQHVMGFALAMHELCTNALKHGALSRPDGFVELCWTVEDGSEPLVLVRWQERDGPPVVTPTRMGFGTRLIRSAIPGPHASAKLRFEPSGVVCELRIARSEGQSDSADGRDVELS